MTGLCHKPDCAIKRTGMPRLLTRNHVLGGCLALLAGFFALGEVFSGAAEALPAPKSTEALFQDSDVVVEGRVCRVYSYRHWLNHLKSGELGDEGIALAKGLPDSEDGVLKLLRNFPFTRSQVRIEGVFVAEIKIEKVFKGSVEKVLFIPFVCYLVDRNASTEGLWSERIYKPGEHLFLNLKKNGPFHESTWWNAVQRVQ